MVLIVPMFFDLLLICCLGPKEPFYIKTYIVYKVSISPPYDCNGTLNYAVLKHSQGVWVRKNCSDLCK